MQRNIIIDCDPSVDDALALMLALASPELKVLAISTAAGVTTSACSAINACKILELCGASHIPVVAGAKQPLVRALEFDNAYCGQDGLNETELPEPAIQPKDTTTARLYWSVLASHAQPVAFVSIAPMMNLAQFVQAEGTLAHVITASGNYGVYRNPQRINPRSSWNMRIDPEAADIVFSSANKIEAVGLDISLQLCNDMVERVFSRANPRSPKTTFLQQAVEFNLRRGLEPYSLLVDALAVAHAAQPSLSSLTCGRVRVDKDSTLLLGNTIFENVGKQATGGNVYAAYAFDFDQYLDMLIERVFL